MTHNALMKQIIAVALSRVMWQQLVLEFTALFNNTRTLKLKAQPTNAFSLPSIKCSEGPPSLRLLPNPVPCLNCAQRFDYRVLGSSRKLGGTASI